MRRVPGGAARQTHRRFCLLTSLAAALLTAAPPTPARAETLGQVRLSVVRSQHALHCPDERALADRIRAMRPGHDDVATDLRIEVVIENEPPAGLSARVLVHGPSKRDPNQLMGRTDGFKTVILPAGVGAIGELVDVTIRRATMATLFA